MSGKRSEHDSKYSTWKKEMKIEKSSRLSIEDMHKLNELKEIYESVSEKHKEWWDKLEEKCNSFSENIKDYSDSQIRVVCGEEIYEEGQQIKRDWEQLRVDMEMYLESKNLPLRYEERLWTESAIRGELLSRDREGNAIHKGFNPPIERWCSRTLNGMTYEIYGRRRIQRIESYTKWGLLFGSAGLIVSIVSIYLSMI
jgi:hypothetical protein